jgi:hypothetical protein
MRDVKHHLSPFWWGPRDTRGDGARPLDESRFPQGKIAPAVSPARQSLDNDPPERQAMIERENRSSAHWGCAVAGGTNDQQAASRRRGRRAKTDKTFRIAKPMRKVSWTKRFAAEGGA